MALPTTRINLRSPYYVTLTRSNLDYIVVELYVYTGELTTDKPSDYNVKMTSTATLNGSGTRTAYIDIAAWARDYVDVAYDFDQQTPTNAVWIEWNLYYIDNTDSPSTVLTLEGSYTAVGLDGGGYFEQEENPGINDTILQSTNYIILPENKDGEIPVLQDYLTGFTLYSIINGQNTILSATTGLTTTENTANVVYYASTSTAGGNPTRCALNYSGGRDSEVVEIRYVKTCKYTPVEVAFVNRHGAIQKLFFFGKTVRNISTQETTYKRNILTSSGTYDSNKHQTTILNKNGRATFTLNSGWYPEDMNGTFQELMLSERVWAKVPQDWLDYYIFTTSERTSPVLVKNQQLQFKTHVDDKLINYTIDVEVASDRINNVR